VADDDVLFLTIIDRLANGGVLTDIVLIGSWVLPIYRAYFHDAPEIPASKSAAVALSVIGL